MSLDHCLLIFWTETFLSFVSNYTFICSTLKSVAIPCHGMKQEVHLSDNDTRDRSVRKMDLSLYCTLHVACVHDIQLKSILAKTNEPELPRKSKCFVIYFIYKSERGHNLTLNTLTWKIWWAHNNAGRWQMGLNSAFKGLNVSEVSTSDDGAECQ